MKVSIIIPVYNKIRYLSTILQQVRQQSFSDYECLLIDDGSTDGSGEICDAFADRDSRFVVFHIPNGGVSNARNMGLEKAKGEYVTFVDADDEILPGYLQNLFDCITESGADIVISGYQKFWDTKDDVVYIRHPEITGVIPIENCLSNFAKVQKNTGLLGCCVSKIFTKKLAQNEFFDSHLRLAEDFDFYLHLYAKAQNLFFDDKYLYRYRQEAENSSALVDDAKIDYLSQLRINLRYREFLRNADAYSGENKAIVEKLLSDYLYFAAFYCAEEIMDVRFQELVRLQQEQDISFVSGNWMQHCVLALLKSGNWKAAKACILSYRALRKTLRRLGG